jgi:hypothetical protein
MAFPDAPAATGSGGRLRRRAGLAAVAGLGALASLAVGGAATFAQDPGTTQTTTTEPSTTTPPVLVTHNASLTAKLRIKLRKGAFVGTGPVTGKPFGKGNLRSRSTVQHTSPLRVKTTLTATYKNGTIVFKGTGKYVGSTFKATVDVSRGTGAYKEATGKKLKVTDRARNGVDTLKVNGKITYPES